MTEKCLVYIYSGSPARVFMGCGALVEGGYVATCRHVWRDALSGEPPEIEIEFPRSWVNGVLSTSRARLADACEGLGPQAPDLVLLKPVDIPCDATPLQLALYERLEVGKGYVHAYLPSRGLDDCIAGEIASQKNAKGQRNFKGDDPENYWFEKGSSGSPLLIANGQQLAGIIARSELGGNLGKSHLREAFIVPATTIRAYIERLRARLVVTDQRSNSDDLQHVPATKPPGVPFDQIFLAAEKLRHRDDKEEALEELCAMIAEIKQKSVGRLLPLSKEHAAIERLEFDHE